MGIANVARVNRIRRVERISCRALLQNFDYSNSVLRPVPGTDDSIMDIEAKKFSPAASTEADAALGFLASEGTAAFTEIDEKKLVRKIDWMIVPLMWAIYFLQYQDKILSK
jgi:hypothetical protein